MQPIALILAIIAIVLAVFDYTDTTRQNLTDLVLAFIAASLIAQFVLTHNPITL